MLGCLQLSDMDGARGSSKSRGNLQLTRLEAGLNVLLRPQIERIDQWEAMLLQEGTVWDEQQLTEGLRQAAADLPRGGDRPDTPVDDVTTSEGQGDSPSGKQQQSSMLSHASEASSSAQHGQSVNKGAHGTLPSQTSQTMDEQGLDLTVATQQDRVIIFESGTQPS